MEKRANYRLAESQEARLVGSRNLPIDPVVSHTRETIGSGDDPAAVLLRGALRSSAGYPVRRTLGTNNQAIPLDACQRDGSCVVQTERHHAGGL